VRRGRNAGCHKERMKTKKKERVATCLCTLSNGDINIKVFCINDPTDHHSYLFNVLRQADFPAISVCLGNVLFPRLCGSPVPEAICQSVPVLSLLTNAQ
jgi:hypothetical protein